jgi:hypothetical protein
MNLKVIHRIYFGFDGKPDPYLGYLENWRRALPDYEIRFWDATNLPLEACEFSREMFRLRDHAFLSDYFRWWVLREYGGVYFDADIEVVNGELLNKMVEELEAADTYFAAIGIDNRAGGWYTGHSMISKKGSPYATFMCEVYEGLGKVAIWRRKIFYFMSPQLSALFFAYSGHNVDGMGTTPQLDVPKVLHGVKVFPQEYFSPLTPAERDGKPSFTLDSYTQNTAICHHFSCSWHESDSPFRLAKGTAEIECTMIADLLASGRYDKAVGTRKKPLRRSVHALRDVLRRLRGKL